MPAPTPDRGWSYAIQPFFRYLGIFVVAYLLYRYISHRHSRRIHQMPPCSLLYREEEEGEDLHKQVGYGTWTPLDETASFEEIIGEKLPEHPHFGHRLREEDYLH